MAIEPVKDDKEYPVIKMGKVRKARGDWKVNLMATDDKGIDHLCEATFGSFGSLFFCRLDADDLPFWFAWHCLRHIRQYMEKELKFQIRGAMLPGWGLNSGGIVANWTWQ